MVHLHTLWLPILLSSVCVFFLSFLFHTVLPIHKNDMDAVPKEDQVMASLRSFNIPPGDYMIPRPTGPNPMKDAAHMAKVNAGPNVLLTVMKPGPFNMAPTLGIWFIYLLGVSVVVAYVCSRAVQAGAPYLQVFRFAGVTAFASYALAQWQESIWFQRRWSTTIKNNLDGLIYALFTAGIFGAMWPR